MSRVETTTNFRDSNGVDLGKKLVTKDYLISVYPEIGQQIGIPPELWSWGLGSNGQLGNATQNGGFVPVTTFAGGTNWKQVTCGNSFTAAIKTDGTLWTWGVTFIGQLGNNSFSGSISTPVTTFAGGTNWKQVSSGSSHTAAIKTDGTLWTWGTPNALGIGSTNPGRLTPVTTFAGGNNWKLVSCGSGFTAAIKTDGTLWTWGFGPYGGLGNAQTSTILTPVTTFAGGTNWKLVSCAGSGGHIAAIKTDGTLWTWGLGSNGQLGDAQLFSKSTPVTTFAGGTNWKQISCGRDHTAAIKTDGTLWTWGNGFYGQLGRLGSITGSATPVTTFSGGSNWADTATTEPEDLYTLSGGRDYTSAIKTDGTLWTWGNGIGGQLGNSRVLVASTPSTTFSGGTNWKQVSCGIQQHTAAIKTDGTLWTWGNGYGVLGNAQFTSRSTPVTTFAGGTNWKQVSCGQNHTAAIKTDGTLWVWGVGSNGVLGNAQVTSRSTPVTTFAGGTNWKQVSCGGNHTAAIKTDGTLWTWGTNNEFGFSATGQLGTNDSANRSTPVTTFAGGTNWKQVSCAYAYTAAIKTDGTLWTWGRGFDGRLGTNTISTILTPVTTFAGGTNWKQVSVGGRHTSAIKTDGTLWTWGNGYDGRLGNASITIVFTPVTTFAGGTNWKQVSSGYFHTVALSDDGVNKVLYTFGNNSVGQLGSNPFNPDAFPSTTFAGGTNWKQVSGGLRYTAAIKTDGTLWTWGNGQLSTLGVSGSRSTPVTTFAGGTNWKQVSAAEQHTAAIQSVDFSPF